jgi:cytoskeletal protein RodZ
MRLRKPLNPDKARFIGRSFLGRRFIACRRQRTPLPTLLALAILVTIILIGCQTQETNNQQSTENEERITETPATDEPATAVPPTQEPTSPATSDPQPATNTANADVTYVRAVQTGDDTWTFHVTVAHPDTGWEDYADGWDVVLPDGTVVKPDAESPFTRLLLHPHENEQPFTRSQSNIVIPANVTSVTVRAHDLVDGFGGKEVVVDLTAVSGTDFEVER